MKNRTNFIFFAFLFLFLNIKCNNNGRKNAKEINRIKVSLTCPKTAYSIPTIIAIEKGFFIDNNLDVTVNYVKTGKVAMDDLVGGNANFANIVETNIAFAAYNNPDIEIICNIERVYDAAIVARKDKNIRSPKDLKGKKIGIMLATTSQVFAERFLNENKIPKNSVEIVNLLPPAMQSAIIEGTGVDAISVWQPYVYNVQKALGENAVTFTGKEIFTGYMNLAGSKIFMEKNPEVVNGILKSYIKAEEFLKNNKEESISIISKVLALDKEVINSIWNQYEFAVSLNKELLDATTMEGDWIHKTQKEFADKQIPDYAKFFNPQYLEKISSDRIKW